MVAAPSIFHHLLNITLKQARPWLFGNIRLYLIEKRCAECADINNTASFLTEGDPQPNVGCDYCDLS